MSRKLITILFIIGSCLYIPGIVLIILGYVALFAAMPHVAPGPAPVPPDFSNAFGAFIASFMAGALMLGVGGIVLLVARIGALMELGKAQDWVWFILMIIFGWPVLLIYLIAVPKPKLAPQYVASPYPYPEPSGQPGAGYQPVMQTGSAYQGPAERMETPRISQE